MLLLWQSLTPGEDFEFYVGRAPCTQPMRTNHTYACSDSGCRASTFYADLLTGEFVGRGKIKLKNESESRTAVYFVGVCAYTSPVCTVTVSVSSGDGPIEPAVPHDGVGLTTCPNCREGVPEMRFAPHLAFCERNNRKCAQCQKVIRKV